MSDIVHTWKQKSMELARIQQIRELIKIHRIQTFLNSFGFSLYAVLSIYYLVTTSEIETELTGRVLIKRSVLT